MGSVADNEKSDASLDAYTRAYLEGSEIIAERFVNPRLQDDPRLLAFTDLDRLHGTSLAEEELARRQKEAAAQQPQPVIPRWVNPRKSPMRPRTSSREARLNQRKLMAAGLVVMAGITWAWGYGNDNEQRRITEMTRNEMVTLTAEACDSRLATERMGSDIPGRYEFRESTKESHVVAAGVEVVVPEGVEVERLYVCGASATVMIEGRVGIVAVAGIDTGIEVRNHGTVNRAAVSGAGVSIASYEQGWVNTGWVAGSGARKAGTAEDNNHVTVSKK